MFDELQFEEVLSQPDPKDDLIKIIDPRMGDNYPLDSVRKVNLVCLEVSFKRTS